jgi:hypothetical protein
MWRHVVCQTFTDVSLFVMRVACLAYSWTLEMGAVGSSEMSVKFYQSIRCHNPEDSIVF